MVVDYRQRKSYKDVTMMNHYIVMTGTSEQSGGGITSVIRLIKKMPVWKKYNIYWLETQVDGNVLKKLWWVIKATIKAPIVISKCKIVHFQMVPGITLLTQLPALVFANLFGKKIVMTIHIGNQLEPYANDRIFKWWLSRSDLILLLAKRWEKLFKESYLDVKVKTDVLYNACEVRQYIPMSKKKKIILFAGTHDSNKAPDILLNAWNLLKDKYPDWHIVFCGNGDVDHYQRMAENLDLKECVEFRGYVVGKEKESLFRETSILCLCSYMEGFPMAVLEAWSNSIAVLTTPVGGLPDVIDEGHNCLTFPRGDFKALANRLRVCIENEDLRRNIAAEGHKMAINNFSVDAISRKLDETYRNILD